MINIYKKYSVYVTKQLTLLLSNLTDEIFVFGDNVTDLLPLLLGVVEFWINALWMLEIRKKIEKERGLSTRDTASSFHGPGHLKSNTNLLPLTKLISTKYSI